MKLATKRNVERLLWRIKRAIPKDEQAEPLAKLLDETWHALFKEVEAGDLERAERLDGGKSLWRIGFPASATTAFIERTPHRLIRGWRWGTVAVQPRLKRFHSSASDFASALCDLREAIEKDKV